MLYPNLLCNTYESVNEVFNTDIGTCTASGFVTCDSTPSDQIYYDIALDVLQNLYFSTFAGDLYRKNLDQGDCEYLGNFNSGINALVSDGKNNVYAIGESNLYRYSATSQTFSVMGSLPPGYYSAGDLFFYKGSLFLTTTDGGMVSSLMEINMLNVSQSCYYMDLKGATAMAAFSIYDGTNSKAYIIGLSNTGTGLLKEIDMEAKSLSSVICEFPQQIYGAAAPYPLTSENAVCILNTQQNTVSVPYINTNNPVTNTAQIDTNIDVNDFTGIVLYDISGRKIKSFKFVNNLDVSDVPAGYYILQFVMTGGQVKSQKLIVQ